jgi:hypothetical protein
MAASARCLMAEADFMRSLADQNRGIISHFHPISGAQLHSKRETGRK